MAHVVKQPRVAYVTEWSHVLAARNVVHVARQEEVVGTVAVKLKIHRRRNPFYQLSTQAPKSALWHRSRLRVDVDSRTRASALREPAARRAHHVLVASVSFTTEHTFPSPLLQVQSFVGGGATNANSYLHSYLHPTLGPGTLLVA